MPYCDFPLYIKGDTIGGINEARKNRGFRKMSIYITLEKAEIEIL